MEQRIADKLLEAGADLEFKLEEGAWTGYTILAIVSQKGNEEIASHLISAGADINAIVEDGEKKGSTIVMLACDRGHKGIAEKLIAAGASFTSSELSSNCIGNSDVRDRLASFSPQVKMLLTCALGSVKYSYDYYILLESLGVVVADDLRHIELSDIEASALMAVPKRKLAACIKRIQM